MSNAAEEVVRVTEEIRPLLAGLGPDVQGAVLADLTAMFFAGMRADVRAEIFPMHIETIRALIPVNERMLREQLQ